MASEAICCGQCSWPVPVESWNQPGGVRCPGCGQTIRVAVFPAIARVRTGVAPEALQAETEASCFYHPESRASIPCDECGRFLCGLCDLEIDGRHLCPTCFEAGVANRKLETVETRRTMHDTMALALATFPLLLFWPAIITAPAALFVAIRKWRAPGSLVPRTRIRFYLAIVFALVEIVGIAAVIIAIARLPRRVTIP